MGRCSLQPKMAVSYPAQVVHTDSQTIKRGAGYLEGNRLLVRKPSGHGLGFLQAPYTIAEWQRRTGRKWKEDLPPWIYETWHFILSREFGLPHRRLSWFTQPAVMAVPITTPQILDRLGVYKDQIRRFTVMTVPFPKREKSTDPLWSGYFVMPHTAKLDDLHGRTMLNIVSGQTFHIYDTHSSRQPKPAGWLSLRTMEDEINRVLSRAESKFCAPNGGRCTPETIGRNTIKPGTLRKLTKAIHAMQNKTLRN